MLPGRKPADTSPPNDSSSDPRFQDSRGNSYTALL